MLIILSLKGERRETLLTDLCLISVPLFRCVKAHIKPDVRHQMSFSESSPSIVLFNFTLLDSVCTSLPTFTIFSWAMLNSG